MSDTVSTIYDHPMFVCIEKLDIKKELPSTMKQLLFTMACHLCRHSLAFCCPLIGILDIVRKLDSQNMSALRRIIETCIAYQRKISDMVTETR